MARTYKQGLDFFPLQLDFFRHKKIRRIKSEFGAKGLLVLLFVLTSVYDDDGYYMEWDEDSCFLLSDDVGCGCSPNLVNEVVQRCIECSFFDERMFTTFSILTSERIQINFQRGVESRARKNPVKVDRKYWLLSEEDTKGYIKVYPEKDNSKKNNDYSEKKDDCSKEKSDKVNKSKLNEIKLNVCPADGYGQHGHVNLTEQEYDDLCKLYLIATVNEYIERVDGYLHKNPNIKAHSSHYQTLIDWLDKDGVVKKSAHSYDLDRLWQHAMDEPLITKAVNLE